MAASFTPYSDLDLLRLIIREQQRQHERLVKVVRAWADAGRIPAGRTVTPRRDVQNYLSAAREFGTVTKDGAGLRGAASSPSPTTRIMTPAPFIICTNNAQKPLLAQTQDLRPKRTHPPPTCNKPLTHPILRSCRISSVESKLPSRSRSVHFADVVRTRVTAYEGENEVTEDLAERLHAPFFFKLLFFILIFDLDVTLISILAIAFALYIQGVFEPLLRFFRPGNQQRRPEAGQNVNQPVRRAGDPNPAPQARAGRPEGGANDAPEEDHNDQVAAEAINIPNRTRWLRALYQSLGMFVGTMLPWWTPDERYIL